MTSAILHQVYWEGTLRVPGEAPVGEHSPTNSPSARSTQNVSQQVGTTVLVQSHQTFCPLGHEITVHRHRLTAVPAGSTAALSAGESDAERSYLMDLVGTYTRTYQAQCSGGAWSNIQTRTDTAVAVGSPTPGLKGDSTSPDLEPGIGSSVLWVAYFTHDGPDVANVGYLGNRPGGTQTLMNPALAKSFPITAQRGGLAYDPPPQPWPGGGARPRVLNIAGRSWSKEIWTRTPGGSRTDQKTDKGFSWLMAFLEWGIPPQDDVVFRYPIMWPAGQQIIGNMKIPGLFGCRGGTSIATTYTNLNATGDDNNWSTTKHFSAGLMSDNGPGVPSGTNSSTVAMLAYSNIWRVGNTQYVGPGLDNYSQFTSASMQRDTWYEICVRVKMHTYSAGVAQRDGLFQVWATPAGASSRTQVLNVGSISWTDEPTVKTNAVDFRNFWGGPVTDLIAGANTAATGTHFRGGFMLAGSINDIPILKAV